MKLSKIVWLIYSDELLLAFNLLKHLPASKLFDLYPFFSHLNNDFSNHLDIMLYDFRRDNGFVLKMSLDCQEQGRILMLTRKQLNTPKKFK